MSYSTLFKALRKDHGLTQIKMAEKIKVSQSFLSKIERGKTRPDVDTFLRANGMIMSEETGDLWTDFMNKRR